MKNMTNKLLAAAALFACFACSKTETDINQAPMNQNGKVYGYFEPLIDDATPQTRGYRTPDFSYVAEVDDQVCIWTPGNSLMLYRVASEAAGHFELVSDGFDLIPGQTYSATYPFVLANVVNPPTSQVVTFEGQTQTDQTGSELRDLAKYVYCWASTTCPDNKNVSFGFRSIGVIIRMIITLPREGMTITEVKLTADSPIFALNGKANFTNGSFTATGALSESLTMSLDDVTVSGNVLTAYLGSAPLPAATYVISVTDDAGQVYKSTEIEMPERGSHTLMKFDDVVVAPEGGYVKLTSMPSDPAGQYILVYPNGTTYRAFSFTKTMENAATAAASVSSVAFADLYDQSSTLYNQVVGGNYVEITGEANATTLVLTPEQEAAAAITIAANSNPWTVTAPAQDLQTTFTAGTYSMRVDHLVADVASDGKADLVASFNATDGVAMMNALRGHNVNVTFDDLINLALAKTDGFDATPGSQDDQFIRNAFTKLVAVARDIVEDNPRNLFHGNSLMPIDFSTNAFDVFKQYHDNAAEISWRISPEKKYGLAQLGYNINADGFTAQVDLPSYQWFYELNESLRQSRVGYSVDRQKFVDYWKNVDNNYTISIDGVKVDNFFEKLANRFLAELPPTGNPFTDEFTLLVASATSTGGEKFKKLGDAYKTLAEKLDTGIQPAYIFKKVE